MREIEYGLPVSGVGGYLEFSPLSDPQLTDTGAMPPLERLDVERWEIWHRYINARLPMSGNNGAISYRRVADDWWFAAMLAFDISYVEFGPQEAEAYAMGPGPHQPFLDGKFEGLPADGFAIRARFHLGDPSFYANPDAGPIAGTADPTQQGAYYSCDRITLDEVSAVNTVQGERPDVVRVLVKGHGSAPLQRWANIVYCGAGALGLEL